MVSHVLNGWPHDHGPTNVGAMVKINWVKRLKRPSHKVIKRTVGSSVSGAMYLAVSKVRGSGTLAESMHCTAHSSSRTRPLWQQRPAVRSPALQVGL